MGEPGERKGVGGKSKGIRQQGEGVGGERGLRVWTEKEGGRMGVGKE